MRIDKLIFRINQQERRIGFTSFNKLIDVLANYVIDGRILFIPLQGSGPCKLSFGKPLFNLKKKLTKFVQFFSKWNLQLQLCLRHRTKKRQKIRKNQ